MFQSKSINQINNIMTRRQLKKELKKHSELVTFTFPSGVCYSIENKGYVYGFYPYTNEVEIIDPSHKMYEDDIKVTTIKEALKELK